MGEWRLLSSWTDEELVARLERARGLPLNFCASDEEMTLEAGWNQARSQAVIGHEPPGLPEPGGIFACARQVLETCDFSDPRIIGWHFRPGTPLAGRLVLLELKAMGLHYLCPVRVGATRAERDGAHSLYAFSVETLRGHIEAGREWFLLTKDHASGVVRFRIEAAWVPGDFPNAWTRLGFLLLGRRYQRAWHRLTHLRLRELTHGHPELLVPALPSGPLVHAGHSLKIETVQLIAQKRHGRRKAHVELEMEALSRGRWWTPLGLGALAGMRSLSAPALVSRWLSRAPGRRLSRLSRALSDRSVARVLGLLALGELVADKLPGTPPRVRLVPLAGRALTGALAGASAGAGRKREVAMAAALGAAAALASSWAFFWLRQRAVRRWHVPAVVAGLAEDAVVAAVGSRLLPALGDAASPRG